MIIMITMKSCSQKARQAFDVNRLSFIEAHGFQQIDANLDSVLTFLSGIQTCPGDNSRFWKQEQQSSFKTHLKNNWTLIRGKLNDRKAIMSDFRSVWGGNSESYFLEGQLTLSYFELNLRRVYFGGIAHGFRNFFSNGGYLVRIGLCNKHQDKFFEWQMMKALFKSTYIPNHLYANLSRRISDGKLEKNLSKFTYAEEIALRR